MSLGEVFFHPFFQVSHPITLSQASTMFLAKPLCFLLALFEKCMNPSLIQNNSLPRAEFKQKLLLSLPGTCELLMMNLAYLSLTMAAVGVFQMLNGTVVFWSFLLSLFFLKRKFNWLHYVSVFLVVGGLVLVGAYSLFFSEMVICYIDRAQEAEKSTPTTSFGVVLAALSQFFAALQFMFEERLFESRDYNTMEAVGVEGVFALGISIIALSAFQFIPCETLRADNGMIQFCAFGVVEDTVFAFRQITANDLLLGMVLAGTFLIIPMDFSGIFIVKYGSGMQRAIAKSLRSICVWIISIGIGWEVFSYLQVRVQ
eukprot:TRINITY_DN3615_c0_g1_i1.p1 TRINITY_DN3615_c0_g1~~TRINITY_DN3615_c0_g1_i1.p1  ORF type:complete len:314 (-),score=8.16 TRINITY_DN3615_c0_g1_i1:275-1216(-)